MTSEQRKSIENGIWMCRTHAKLIDSDEATYTIQQLKEWKRDAESAAERRLQTGTPPFPPESGLSRSQLSMLAQAVVSHNSAQQEPTTSSSEGLHAEIDDACEYLLTGQPKVALSLLERIRKRKWDQASPRERYRIHANIGNAQLALQTNTEAARSFLKAARYQPTDEAARSLEALAHFFLDEPEKAHELASKLVAEQPESGRAHMIRIRSAPKSVSLEQLRESVPKAALTAEVMLALHDRAVNEGQHTVAEQIVRNFNHDEEGWAPLTLALAGTILQQLLFVHQTGVTNASVQRLDRALEVVELCTRALTEIPKGDPQDLAFGAYINRGTGYGLRNQEPQARDDFREARGLRPSDERAVIALVQSLSRSEAGIDEAITTSESFLREHSSPPLKLLHCRFLLQRDKAEDAMQATEHLEALLSRLSDLPEMDQRGEVVASLADLYIGMDDPKKIKELFDSATEDLLGTVLRATIMGDAFRRLGRAEDALTCANEARAALGESQRPNEILPLAQLMGFLGEDVAAFELWRRVITPTFVSFETTQLLVSARRAGDDLFILDFCQQLRGNGLHNSRIIMIELDTLVSYGEFRKARNALQDHLRAQPEDKVARLRLTGLGLEFGWESVVERNHALLPGVGELDTADVGAIVTDVLRSGPEPTQAVDYAYALYRRFPGAPLAHRALIVSVLGPDSAKLKITRPTVAAEGVAVCYRAVEGEEARWLVIEDAPEPSLERNEYPTSHPLAEILLGKAEGDEFVMPGLRKQKFLIIKLIDKSVYRANELLKRWRERFPDNSSFETFKVKHSEPPSPEDFAEVTAVMKELTEDRGRLVESYVDGRVPISTLAQLNGKTVLETVRYLAANSKTPVRACEGTEQERDEAVEALDEPAETVVLDPSAVATFALLEDPDLLDSLPFDILITESTLHELREAIQGPSSQARGYMGYRDGRLFLEEVDQDQDAQYRGWLKQVKRKLEQRCEIIGGKDLAKIDVSLRRRVGEFLVPASAESVAVANQRGVVLWSDDHLLYRLVDQEGLPVRRVWTDLVFLWAAMKDLFDQKRRSRVVARLLRCGYSFTSWNTDVVLDTCRAKSWRSDQPELAAVLASFGNTAWSVESGFGIVHQTISRIWREAPSEEHARVVTNRLLAHLRMRADHAQIAKSLLKNVEDLLGLAVMRADSLRELLRSYLQGAAIL